MAADLNPETVAFLCCEIQVRNAWDFGHLASQMWVNKAEASWLNLPPQTQLHPTQTTAAEVQYHHRQRCARHTPNKPQIKARINIVGVSLPPSWTFHIQANRLWADSDTRPGFAFSSQSYKFTLQEQGREPCRKTMWPDWLKQCFPISADL